jgi:hypothetical protein
VSGRLRRVLRSIACAVVLLGQPSVARTQAAPSLVVIVSSDPATPTSQRVAKELRGLGLDVLILKATPENAVGRASLERSARSVGAIAALRLIEASEGLEVWVADRVTGKTVIRQLVGPPGTPTDPEDVALGAVELLRASLMELHAPTPSRGEVDVEIAPTVRQIAYPPAAVAPPAPNPYLPVLALSAGPGVDLGLRALGPSLHATVAGWAKLSGPLGARAFVSMPLLAERASVPEGHVQLRSDVLGLGLSFERGMANGWVTPQVTLGVAACHVGTWGKAAAPLVSSFEQGWYGGAYAQLGAALRLTRGIRLRLDGTAVLLAGAPSSTIKQDPSLPTTTPRSFGTWGAPAGIASLGLEVLWAP